ncbi:uncharacterized protein CTHT_0024490 [Thermochaetoides thermophila DSM 1495]|jgi:hypothetical protein|uniref:Uncharacterized protein n=1 Tax=Chaetomium thermophilum (strain DSM 1495 / CBS 144.50 / IMI 039719) TaxID=759272 RepID=G0S5E2_CHATD|nr:hypothetical protein CTHT_0024490 [Thermochaetoides thermophila DSM 1495]EGS20615.1 hypothetical protein CTHT_0024490 [Thermochaetoides thermophila DSM 1495]
MPQTQPHNLRHYAYVSRMRKLISFLKRIVKDDQDSGEVIVLIDWIESGGFKGIGDDCASDYDAQHENGNEDMAMGDTFLQDTIIEDAWEF